MKIQYNGSSKILKRLVELVNRSQNVALRQDNTDKNTLYWTGLDGVEITVNIPSGAVEVDTELSEASTNPVENQAITKELAQKADKSDIPAVGNGTLSVQRNGKNVGSFSANATEDASINIPVPEKISELENDAGYTKNTGTYIKPPAGIPKSDLASNVQASLGKADTALQKHQDISGKLDKTGDASNTTVTFSAASARENVKTGEKLSVIVGKIAKWFADLKTVAFTGSYNDLANKPTIPDGSKYLPLAGGMMTGDIDLASNGVDLLVGTQRAAQGTYASAVAGATVAAKEPLKTGLSKRKSLIGSWLDQNSAWHSILSVRHRNGWNDGPSYGFYLRSLLTSSGDLYWNKQTGVDKWQGERVLLDSANYSRYAAPLSHAHRDIDQIGNVGYYGSDEANSDGWYKIYSGKLTGYADRVARLSIVRGYGRGHGIVLFHLRCDNNSSIKIHDLLWETRYKFDEKHIAIKTNGNEYGIYVYQSSIQWGRIKVRVLESCGTSSSWTMTLSNNSTKESSFTPTATGKDGSTVAKAKEADTLTDSGWVDVSNFKADISSFSQITTSFRKYGDIVFIRGRVQPKSNMTSISLCSTTSTSLTGITPNHSVKGVGVSTDGLTPFMVNITTSPANSVILKGSFSANKIYDFEFSYIK